MHFEIVDPILLAKTIARGSGNDALLYAELHWYEASGLGKLEFKIKRFMQRP